MTDEELQRKLNKFVKLGNELVLEARRRYANGNMFHEAEGGVHIMDGDEDSGGIERQRHIRHTARGIALWGHGCW